MSTNPNIHSFRTLADRPTGNFRPSRVGSSSTTALAIWVTVQLAALGFSSLRVMLWAREPLNSEQFALSLMLAVQIGLSAMIFPTLVSDSISLGAAILSASAMGELASFLASGESFVAGAIYVAIWLIALSLVARSLRDPREQLIAAAAAALFALGGPILVYLREEFANGRASLPQSSTAAFGPIFGALSLKNPNDGSRVAWIELGIFFVLALVFCLMRSKGSPQNSPNSQSMKKN
jgi:hypothetical protein